MILTGDFNQDIVQVHEMIAGRLGLAEEKRSYNFNTENRVQKRERDGWSGIQVI